MSKATSETDSSIGRSTTSGAAAPSIERGRFARAVTEDMTTERVADRFYEVHSQSGNTYEIDLQTGACTCPDCEQRGDRYVCKHAIRASLVEIIAEGVTTRPVAKVAGYARNPENECPTEDLDEYDIWMTVVAPDRDRNREQNRASVEGAATASATAEVGQ